MNKVKILWSVSALGPLSCSYLPTLPWLHVAVRWQQRAEAKQRQVHSRTSLLHLGPALSSSPGAPGRWGRWGQVGVGGARVAVMVLMAVVVVVGIRMRDAAVAVATNQEGLVVVAVVQHTGRHQQHQDEGAEQEEEHVDAFGLRREA